MPQRIVRIAVLIATLTLFACPAHSDDADRSARLQTIATGEQKILDRFITHIAQPGAEITQRDLPNYALGALVLGRDPQITESMLRTAFSAQVMDTQAPGNYLGIPVGQPLVVRMYISTFLCGCQQPCRFG